MNNEHDFDRLIDSALHEYREAEPRGGLEKRILAHVAAASEKRARFAWWRWAFVPVVALLFVLAFVSLREKPKEIGPTPNMAKRPELRNPLSLNLRKPALEPSREVRRIVPRNRMRTVARSRGINGKEPTPNDFIRPVPPRPMTQQERTLLALARFSVQALTPPSETKPVEPLQVRRIEVTPLSDWQGGTQ